jgi:hypothetical protein
MNPSVQTKVKKPQVEAKSKVEKKLTSALTSHSRIESLLSFNIWIFFMGYR